MSKAWKKVKKVVAPLAIAAAVIYTGGAALGALGAAGAGTAAAGTAAAAATTVSSTALLAAPVGSAAGFSIAKVGTLATIGGAVSAAASSALPLIKGASAVSGLLGGSGQAQKITNSPQGVGADTNVATRSSAEVEQEELKRRRQAAAATTRQSTVRAGALASRPVLGAAGLLG